MAQTPNVPLSLPRADLRDVVIPPETLLRLPYDIAVEFAAVFFAESATDISLGISHPELLKDNTTQALAVLEKEVGKKIKLFQISDNDLKQVLKLYKDASKAVTAKKPVTDSQQSRYQAGGAVASELLLKIPADYAASHRLLAVDKKTDGTIWFVTDQDNQTVRTAAELIARRNNFTENITVVPTAEFDRLLGEQKKALNQPVAEPVKEADSAATKPSGLTTIDSKGQPTEDITAPDYKGTILTGEVEKPGFAGLFQKAALFFAGKPTAPVTVPVPPAAAAVDEKEVVQDTKPAVNETAIKDAGSAAVADEKDKETTPSAEPAVQKLPVPAKTADEPKEEESIIATEAPSNAADAMFVRPVTNLAQLQNIVHTGNIMRIVAGIINLAVESKASDVHMEPFGDEFLVRYRVDGQLSEVLRLPMSLQPAMVSRVKILSKLKLDESRVPQDGRFDVTVSGQREIDIRVSTLPTVHGEKVVMRLLDKSEGIYTLEKLGLAGEGFNRLVTAIKQAYGVVLSTGPTGSGKTTTLYAILQRVATTNVNVITLEDPVEYEMKGINQSQIKDKIGFTFAEGLRSVLRQDPNIIMVGEVRDGETASMVTHAALTGHLVLSTLHTNNAAGALPRLINMGIEPFLITSAINAVVGQRLVRRLCPNCRQKFELPAAVRSEIDEELKKIVAQSAVEAKRIPAEINFYRSVGCDQCTNGYRGRVGLFEVLVMSPAIEDLAVRKAPAVDIERTAITEGMITMKQDGILKVLEGVTTLDEVLRETSSR